MSTSWRDLLSKTMEGPVPFNKEWDFLKKTPDDIWNENDFIRKMNQIEWRGLSKDYKEWFFKGPWIVATEYSGISDMRVFLFIFNGKKKLTKVQALCTNKAFFQPKPSPPIEIREFIKAIGDPQRMTMNISFAWAQPLLEAYFREV